MSDNKNIERNVKGLVFCVLCVLLTLIWLSECSTLSSNKKEVSQHTENISRTTVSVTNSKSPDKMRTYYFEYKFKQEIYKQNVFASSQEIAFKSGAKKCFMHFTKGKFPGDEVGLDIIDSCANPIKESYSDK